MAGPRRSVVQITTPLAPVLAVVLVMVPSANPLRTRASMVSPARPSVPPALNTLTRTLPGVIRSPAANVDSVQAACSAFSGNGSVTDDQAQATPITKITASTARVTADLVRALMSTQSVFHPDHAGMQHVPLLERCPQRAVQAVLEVELLVPKHDVGEQVAEEGRVLVEQRRELERVLGRDQLVEPHLPRRHRGPLLGAEAVVGVRPTVADPLEDHGPDSRGERDTRPSRALLQFRHDGGELARAADRTRLRVRGPCPGARRPDDGRRDLDGDHHPDPARNGQPARSG